MEYFLIIVLLLAVAAITFHAAGLEPSRVVKKWLVRLANGQSIPEKPDLSWWLTWLLPLHYEARAVFQRMNAMREENRLLRERIGEFEYLQYYILGSLMEGVLVVNDKLEITMINAEFLNIYQLQQSPLKQTLEEALGETPLNEIVRKTLRSGKIQTDRVTGRLATGGRWPSFDVNAIPLRDEESGVFYVIVVFLPLPDRLRLPQVRKQHEEKIQRLAEEWTRRGKVLVCSTVADLPDEPAKTPVPAPQEAEEQAASLKS